MIEMLILCRVKCVQYPRTDIKNAAENCLKRRKSGVDYGNSDKRSFREAIRPKH